jgi:ferredoxin
VASPTRSRACASEKHASFCIVTPAVAYIIAEPCIDVKDRTCVDVCPVDCIHEAGRMLVIDPEECIDCWACEPECPVEAIYPEDSVPEQWAPFVVINAAFGDGLARVDQLVDGGGWPRS